MLPRKFTFGGASGYDLASPDLRKGSFRPPSRTPKTPGSITRSPSGYHHSPRTGPSLPRTMTSASRHRGFKLPASAASLSVGVRMRPLIRTELDLGGVMSWKCEGHSVIPCLPPELAERTAAMELSYEFDHVFPPSATTSNVYKTMATDIISSAMQGYNGTIFAYGQTASGKTHTLMGTKSEPGITILSVRDLFRSMAAAKDTEYLVRVSYIELYNEEIRDLLDVEGTTKLSIGDDPSHGPYVRGLKERVVMDPEAVLELMAFGESNRHVAETDMNSRSSRSHTLFRMVIESRQLVNDDDDGTVSDDESVVEVHDADSILHTSPSVRRMASAHSRSLRSVRTGGGLAAQSLLEIPTRNPVRVSVLNLVDLAGSERVGKSGVSGVHLKEGTFINKSLVTLGTVISKLANGTDSHIPYRESKLTRLLSLSLGGNAKTAVVVTISPSSTNLGETRGALKFALRAKKVVNRVRVNEVSDSQSLLEQYKQEVAQLRKALLEGGGGTVITASGEALPAKEMIKRIQDEHSRREAALEEAIRSKEETMEASDARVEQLSQLLFLASHATGNLQYAGKVNEDLANVATGRASAPDVVNSLMDSVPGLRGRMVQLLTRQRLARETGQAMGAESGMTTTILANLPRARTNPSSSGDSAEFDFRYYSPSSLGRQIESLQTDLAAYKKENEDLRRKLDIVSTEAASSEQKAAELKTTLADLGDQYERLQSSATSASVQLDAQESRDRTAQLKIQRLEAQVDTLSKSNKSLEAEIRALREKHTASMQEAESKISNLRRETLRMTETIEAQTSNSSTAKAELEEQIQRLVREKATVERQLEASRKQEESAVAALNTIRAQRDELQKEHADQAKELLNTRAAHTEAQAVLEALTSRLTEISSERDRAVADASAVADTQEQVKELEDELQRVRSERSKLQLELEKSHHVSQRLEISLDSTVQERDRCGARIEQLGDEVHKYQTQARELERRLENASSESEQVRGDIAEVQERCDSQARALAASTRQAKQLEIDLQAALSRLEHTEQRLATMSSENRELGRRLAQGSEEQETLTARIQELLALLEEEQEARAEAEAAHTAARASVDADSEEFTELVTKLEQERQTTWSLNRQLQDLEAQRSADLGAIEIHEAELKKARKQILDQEKTLAGLRAQLRADREETSIVQLARIRNDNAGVVREVGGLRSELHVAKERWRDARSRFDSLRLQDGTPHTPPPNGPSLSGVQTAPLPGKSQSRSRVFSVEDVGTTKDRGSPASPRTALGESTGSLPREARCSGTDFLHSPAAPLVAAGKPPRSPSYPGGFRATGEPAARTPPSSAGTEEKEAPFSVGPPPSPAIRSVSHTPLVSEVSSPVTTPGPSPALPARGILPSSGTSPSATWVLSSAAVEAQRSGSFPFTSPSSSPPQVEPEACALRSARVIAGMASRVPGRRPLAPPLDMKQINGEDRNRDR